MKTIDDNKYLAEVVEKNKKIDTKVILEVERLQRQAEKFGHKVQSGYNLTPPLGNQILLFGFSKK